MCLNGILKSYFLKDDHENSVVVFKCSKEIMLIHYFSQNWEDFALHVRMQGPAGLGHLSHSEGFASLVSYRYMGKRVNSRITDLIYPFHLPDLTPI